MKGKLSARKYVLQNKKQVWIMILSLALTFMTMYVINFLFLSTSESMHAHMIDQPKKVGYVSLTSTTMGLDGGEYESQEDYQEAYDATVKEIIEKIKQHDGIENAYFGQACIALYQGIVGGFSYEFPLLTPEQIPEYLDHFDVKVIEGRMPENDGEVLVAEKVLKNQHMKLNEYFNKNVWGTNFKVVGVIDSDELVCVGTPQGYCNAGWYFTILCDEKNSDMTKVFSDLGYPLSEYDTVIDSVEQGKWYKEIVTDQLEVALLWILIVVIIFLAISVLVAYISFLRNRMNEYCLYTSIGYGRKEVYGMIMREVMIIFGSSILLGAIVTTVILVTLANCMLDPLGLLYRYFYPEHLLKIVSAFAAIVGVLQIPIVVTIHNIKTIDRIEE